MDHVAIDSTANGFYLRSNEQASCTRCTAIHSAFSGWSADELTTQPGIMASSSCASCLAVDNGHEGFRIDVQRGGWSITGSDAFGNATDFDPSPTPELVDPQQIDPMLAAVSSISPRARRCARPTSVPR